MRRSVRWQVRLVGILAPVLAWASCLPAPSSWEGAEDGVHVGLVGDSILYIAEYGPGLQSPDPDRYLSFGLSVSGAFRVSRSLEIGASTADLADLPAWPDPGVQILVVAMGTNDMKASTDPVTGEVTPSVSVPDAVERLATYVDRVAPTCTVLVGVNESGTRWGLDRFGPAWNEAERALLEGRTGVFVDWAAVVRARPELLKRDGAHLTPEGYSAYAASVIDGILACRDLLPPDDTTTTTEPESTTTTTEDSTTTTEPEPTTTEPDTTTTEPEPTTTTEPEPATTEPG